MKPIETMYAGCRFRSRLEARWAVFFDHLDIQWEYEPQGFELPTGRRYLPDFWLPGIEPDIESTWVEVKGNNADLDYDLLCALLDHGNGLPHTDRSLDTGRGLIILGPIPRPREGHLPVHPILQHHKGVWAALMHFGPPGLDTVIPLHEDHEWFGDGMAGAMYGSDLIAPRYGYAAWLDRQRAANRAWVIQTVNRAYTAARSARFEHGASGA